MRWLDRAYLRLFRPLSCFPEGWGELDGLDGPFAGLVPGVEPGVPAIRWRKAHVHARARSATGEIESPELGLPDECRRARVRLLTGRERRAAALVVVLASWNDQDFRARQRLLVPAVERGELDALLLENAFYGQRRRAGQEGARIAHVSDFLRMGRATVREAHALLAWGRAQGYARVGVVGYSMGGQMAAMTAALAPWPVHVVAMAPAATPVSVFLDGPLRRDVAWDALGPEGASRLRQVLSGLSVLSLPPVKEPAWATLVGTRHDAIVPPEDVVAIGRHWGVSPRWLDDGHVSALALRVWGLRQAIVDTLAR